MKRQDDTDIQGDSTVVTHVPDLGPIRRRASSAPPKLQTKPQLKRAATTEELQRMEESRGSTPSE